ncbi:MAG: ATPase domain-containing protein [archaeon]
MKKSRFERVPTHISGFDKLVNGGFKKRSMNLIIGGAGSGKTIFSVAYLVNGILKHNEPGMYITFEEKKEELYENMSEFGWNLEKLEKEKKFIFLEYSPERVKKLLVEGGGLIENIITRYNIKRLVIDSITSFVLLYQDELAKKEAALSLFGLLRSWGCTTLLTSEKYVVNMDRVESGGLEFEVDSIILMYHVKEKGIRKRAIEVLKMRGTRHAEKTIKMEMTDNGVVVYPNKIIIFKDEN